MTKTNTKRALMMSGLALLLCVSMLVGSTYAWFTDSVASGKNTIASGNLDVELYYAATAADVAAEKWTEVDNTTDAFGYDNWEPGYTKVVYFKVKNNGSLALKYQLSAVIDNETPGKNKDGQQFYLSNYIKYAMVDTNATRDSILALNGTSFKTAIALSNGDRHLAKGESEVIGLALWMPTTVDNVANHNGTDVPSIEFGVHLLATQDTVESDSFDKYYDANAKYPNSATNDAEKSYGSVPVEEDTEVYEFDIYNNENGKTGFARVFKDSVADDAENISVMVVPAILDTTVPVTTEQNAKSFNITVTGIKDDNTTPVEVWFDAGVGLSNVVLYHNNEVVENATYDPQTGTVRFQSVDFSPYTVVFDEKPEDTPDTKVPVANVTEVKPVETIAKWESFGGLTPADPAQQLEAMFTFAAQHNASTVDDCEYKDWYCDFYVMMDREVPDGAICLGGNYGTWGWVGFNNTGMTVPANTAIPLLSTATGREVSGWTYASVVGFVEVFKCGVARSNNTDLSLLQGATFSVMLRIVNPENTSEYIDVNTVKYTFGETFGKGTTVIENYRDNNFTIETADELLDFAQRVNAGESFEGKTVVLGADVDLSTVVWTPIGTGANPFNGTFDGNGKTVTLNKMSGDATSLVDSDDYGYAYGLFGVIGWATDAHANEKITIKNLNLNVSYETDDAYVMGGLVGADAAGHKGSGRNRSLACDIEISNVTVNGKVISQNEKSGVTIGGIAGKLYTQGNIIINGCTNNAEISAETTSGKDNKVGGILGFYSGANSVVITNNTNNGAVTSKSVNAASSKASGICITGATTQSTNISNNQNNGDVAGTGDAVVAIAFSGNDRPICMVPEYTTENNSNSGNLYTYDQNGDKTSVLYTFLVYGGKSQTPANNTTDDSSYTGGVVVMEINKVVSD